MRAVVVREFGGPEAVEVVEAEVPEPGAREVRIKVAAAPLNPVDVGLRAGAFGGAGKQVGLGWDVAGVVDAVGVAGAWAVGDRVVALDHGISGALGAQAEFVVVPVDAVAVAPRGVDEVHASTLPLNGLTALQGLDAMELGAGQTLLVTGAAGGVGAFVVQLAVQRGVSVTGLAREGDAEYVRGLGAEFAGAGDVEGEFDGVFDAAVLGEAALGWVRDGGVYMGVMPQGQPAGVRGIRTSAVEVAADGAQLAGLVKLMEEGVLTTRVAGTYGLEEAGEAHARFGRGGVGGRLVLVP
ncbi:zinc-binding dehydrogenase [Streptomyces roseirectus]|uniref:Zinc-binding dehydrogenase n=1 Tax=Streptomyces roseirectus TaxID=2768066 RepID=A0A7H0IDT3_9ACTN|nr:zinc-binding dehydrogenase [Streptomyces roseirectus]QNP70949.1 zinc-binding dehydrogenase [Streptomyces roseirectus]